MKKDITEIIHQIFDPDEALRGLEDLDASRKAKEVADRLRGDVRRTGRTTRIVDAAIQELFTKGEVQIADHHHEGNHAMSLFILRMNTEHRGIKFGSYPGYIIKLTDWHK